MNFPACPKRFIANPLNALHKKTLVLKQRLAALRVSYGAWGGTQSDEGKSAWSKKLEELARGEVPQLDEQEGQQQ